MPETTPDQRWRLSRSKGLSEVDPARYGKVLQEHYNQMMATAQATQPEQWSTPSRCSEWTVHQVWRHVADTVQLQLSGFTGEAGLVLDDGGPFDPNITPDRWLAHSQDESPTETVARYQAATSSLLPFTLDELGRASVRMLQGPYGEAHWSTISCHVFWDNWLHQRDVAVALELDVPSTLGQLRLAAMYGLLMASLPAAWLDQHLETTVCLTTDHFDPVVLGLNATAQDLVVTELPSDTAASLTGELIPVVDALSGRGRPLAEVLDGPADIVEGLSLTGLTLKGAG